MKPLFFVTRNYPPAWGGIESMAAEILEAGIHAHPKSIILIHIGQKRLKKPPQGLYRYYHAPGDGMASTILISTLVVFFLGLLYRPKIIVNMQVTTALGSYMVSRLFKVPHHVVALGLEVMPWPQTLFEGLKNRVFKNSNRVISISHYTESLVFKYGVVPARSQIIHPGVHPHKFAYSGPVKKSVFHPSLGSKAFVCLFTGRLVPRKGVDQCILALTMLAAQIPDIYLAIVGEGPDKARLKDLCRQHQLEDRVFFMGQATDSERSHYYASADIFVMPSRIILTPPEVEGFGIVYLEAALAQLPALGSTQGGVPDAVVHGQTGYNVDPTNTALIADTLQKFYQERSVTQKMGFDAKKRVETQFNWKTLAPEFSQALFEA